MGAVADLKKARESWENQKQNNLTDARICDATIKALTSAIEIVEAYDKKVPKKTPEVT